MVDVKMRLANGETKRVRRVSPVQTKRGAEQFERQLRADLLNGDPAASREETVECPTLESFASEFLANYVEANNKPSEVAAKRRIIKLHLTPVFGSLRIEQIRLRDIERFKAQQLKKYAPKTVNNQLAVLSRILRVAVEWELIDAAPTMKPLKGT